MRYFSCSPIIVLSQCHLLKVNVNPLGLRGLQHPVTRQVVAVVAGETRRDNPADGDVPHQSTTGS